MNQNDASIIIQLKYLTLEISKSKQFEQTSLKHICLLFDACE